MNTQSGAVFGSKTAKITEPTSDFSSNFNKTDSAGNTKNFLRIPDELNGRFVVIGIAKFYISIGTMKGKITWKE